MNFRTTLEFHPSGKTFFIFNNSRVIPKLYSNPHMKFASQDLRPNGPNPLKILAHVVSNFCSGAQRSITYPQKGCPGHPTLGTNLCAANSCEPNRVYHQMGLKVSAVAVSDSSGIPSENASIDTGVCEKTPPERKTLGSISLKNTKSSAG